MRRLLLLLTLLLAASTIPMAGQTTHTFGALDTNNVWTGTNSYSKGVVLGPVTVSQLSSLIGAGAVVIVSDGTPGSSPCAGSGTGAFAIYVNSQWSCNNGVTGSGGTVTSIATASPITGGTITTSGTIACPTCVTSTGGGPLTASLPITISGAGNIAINNATLSAVGAIELANDLGGTGTAPTVVNLSHVTNASLANSGLANSSINVIAGIGLTGGGSVALGGGVTLNAANSIFPGGVAALNHPVYVYYSNGGLQTVGNSQVANIEATNTFAHLNPTATDGYGVEMEATASASTSVVIGADQGRNSNTTEYGFGGFYAWALRWGAGNTTNVRYWLGVTQYNTGGSGTETQVPISTSSFATNTPNRSTLAFRYAAGTDSTWQCTSQTTGGSQTLVNSGVAIDTNNHTFVIAYTNATAATFYIDGTLVCTITTNLPNGTTYYYLDQFWAGDNENTATAITANMYWMDLSLK